MNCFVFGSYTSICLALGPGSGKYLANLFIAPSLQNAGCCCGARIRAVTHTRPWLSIVTLRGSADRCQIFSFPQNGDAGVSVSIGGALDGTLISSRGVLARIEHGNDVGALDGSVDQPVRVHRRRALVGRGHISSSAGRQGPVPHRDHEVALEAGRTWRGLWDKRPRRCDRSNRRTPCAAPPCA